MTPSNLRPRLSDPRLSKVRITYPNCKLLCEWEEFRETNLGIHSMPVRPRSRELIPDVLHSRASINIDNCRIFVLGIKVLRLVDLAENLITGAVFEGKYLRAARFSFRKFLRLWLLSLSDIVGKKGKRARAHTFFCPENGGFRLGNSKTNINLSN